MNDEMNPDTTTMTPTEINRRIAEACGWKKLPKSGEVQYMAQAPDGNWGTLPNYHGDLNAMHEAGKTLNTGQLIAFMGHLYEISGADVTAASYHHTHGYEESKRAVLYSAGLAHLSTAAQRAEAFLRTIGKWEDGK